MTYKVFESSDTNVKKFVFEWDKADIKGEAIAEAVYYIVMVLIRKELLYAVLL